MKHVATKDTFGVFSNFVPFKTIVSEPLNMFKTSQSESFAQEVDSKAVFVLRIFFIRLNK